MFDDERSISRLLEPAGIGHNHIAMQNDSAQVSCRRVLPHPFPAACSADRKMQKILNECMDRWSANEEVLVSNGRKFDFQI